MDTPDTPVFGIGTALHQIAGTQTVDHAGNRDRLDLEPLGDLSLTQPRRCFRLL